MNTSTKLKIDKVWFTADKIAVRLTDGREVACPLAWFPRLENASLTDRNNFELICDGTAIHWEALDEDLSAEGFLTFSPPMQLAV